MSAQGQTGPTTQGETETLAIRLWKLVTPEEIRADEAGVKDSLFMDIAAEVERQITAARAQALRDAADEMPSNVTARGDEQPISSVHMARRWLRDRASRTATPEGGQR